MSGGVSGAQVLNTSQQHKAHHLWQWARESGQACSRDEVADMIIFDQVRPRVLGLGFDVWYQVMYDVSSDYSCQQEINTKESNHYTLFSSLYGLCKSVVARWIPNLAQYHSREAHAVRDIDFSLNTSPLCETALSLHRCPLTWSHYGI